MTIAPPKDAQQQQLVFERVSWDYYDRTVRELEGSRQRVTYCQGRMEIMSPSNRHEGVKKHIARLLEVYALERDIPITGLGSVTCQRKDLQLGLEPDECYYVSTPPPPEEPVPLDLSRLPPPDLAIEVDITNSSIPREPIYAALGVREIWRFDGNEVMPALRQPDGQYEPSDQSLAFPSLPMVEFNRFLTIARTESQHAAAKAMRDWARNAGG